MAARSSGVGPSGNWSTAWPNAKKIIDTVNFWAAALLFCRCHFVGQMTVLSAGSLVPMASIASHRSYLFVIRHSAPLSARMKERDPGVSMACSGTGIRALASTD